MRGARCALQVEIARGFWQELQPHFARGATVFVDPSLDLLTVAQWVADDNSTEIGKLMQQQQFGVVSEQQAHEFLRSNQEMWALVIAPWVLVQPISDIHAIQ